MRKSILPFFILQLASCSANAHVIANQPLNLVGDSLPPMRHVIEMKAVSDTLWLVYETEDGFGQRFLRRAIIDNRNNALDVGSVIGKKSDGYFMAYMPYPTIDIDGNIQIVNQEDGEIFNFVNDSVLIRTKNYILSGNCSVPFPISQYVQDVSSVDSDNYVFVGREPNGGEQYAMKANVVTAEIDTIRKIRLSPGLTTWLPNAGELAYSKQHDMLVFAYRLHPIIELFGMDGKLIKQVRLGQDTFNPETLENADFEDYNPLHIVDISVNADYIYALYWGYKYIESTRDNVQSLILQIDWNGNVVNQYLIKYPFKKISVYNNNCILGWNGSDFYIVKITD